MRSLKKRGIAPPPLKLHKFVITNRLQRGDLRKLVTAGELREGALLV